MTEAAKREPAVSWLSVILSAWHDPTARILNVDLLTVLIALLLPWSTTGVVICVVLWIVALAPTLEMRSFLPSLKRPVCAAPIAFFALALVGTLWTDASWAASLNAVGPTAKFLVLPLLLYHFERSPRGVWVFVAFLASCTLLTAVSCIDVFYPHLSLKLYLSSGPFRPERGIAVKNHIDQGQEFALCAVALAYPVMTSLRSRKPMLALLFALLTLNFLVNMVFVVVSRTALVTMPILLAVFALLHLKWRSVVIILLATVIFVGLAWVASPGLRNTAGSFFSQYELYREQNAANSIGLRLEYWQKSLRFFADAPVIGHGTGSTRGLFERAAVGQTGARAEIIGNPHNQTLNVAVQWGVIGIVVLYAMWLLHLLMFRGNGLANWTGMLVVVQNIFTSLFNSHLSDFHEGWMYVLGVGVAGGMTLGATKSDRRTDASSHYPREKKPDGVSAGG
jgi:O-antigen ligase